MILSDMPGTSGNLPRATLIVLGFNQEEVIDTAIKGALEQDYANLESILSDDRSSDQTFQRMERAVGPIPRVTLFNLEPHAHQQWHTCAPGAVSNACWTVF